MKYAISILEAEGIRLTGELTTLTRTGKPKDWRASEWAMHLGSLKLKRGEIFKAIQTLKCVTAERNSRCN